MNTKLALRIFQKFTGLLSVLVLLVTGCIPVAGSSVNGNTMVWIESPLPERTLLIQEIIFTVYATDANGVAGINLWINGIAVSAAPPVAIREDGSTRMVRLDQVWLPPVEGTYVLTAQAVATSGETSSTTSVTFCIVTCGPATSQPSNPPGNATPFPTPAVRFWASPPSVNAGECTTLYWEVSGALNVLLDRSWQPATGSQMNCICQPQTFTLTVQDMNSYNQDYPLTVGVTGSCQLPVTTPPPDVPSPTQPPAPADTNGPVFNSVNLSWDGCTVFGEAQISDPSGVIWAEFWFNRNDEGWSWIQMNDQGTSWLTQTGFLVGPTGTIQYKVRSLDTLYNESWSEVVSHNYAYCGE